MEGTLPTPAEIAANLSQYVVGQEDAKRVISVAVFNHYKRIKYADKMDGIEIKKSNVMMIGPTGSGKTYIIQTLSRMLGVPLSMADATVVVSSENVGRELENILINLVRTAGSVEKAQEGMVFIDEIDKLVTGTNRSKGETIQQALLKIIEGTKSQLVVDDKKVELDTSNILFVVGGAFVNLASMVQIRLGDTKAGLLSEEELVKQSTTDDLSKFGLIPEFVGRIPVIVTLTALSQEGLIEALVRPKNNIISQFKKMFELDGYELVFTEECLVSIAKKAIALKTGARGLRTVVEGAMRDITYNVPNEKNLKKIVITPDVIEKNAAPIFEYVQSVDESELTPLPEKKSRSLYAHGD